MTYYSAAILAASTCAFGLYVFMALDRTGWRRYAGPALFGAMIAAQLLLFPILLGRPTVAALAPSGQLPMISYRLDEPNAIYLWVLDNDGHTPISIQRPWSIEEAEALMEAFTQANANHTAVIFDASEYAEGPGAYHAAPPEDLPLKTPAPEGNR